MKTLVLDIEGTTYNKGNPFDTRNNLVAIAYKVNDTEANTLCVSHNLVAADAHYQETICDFIGDADLIIGFNFKFDYHWLRKYGILTKDKLIWDVQYAQFLIERQRNPYPSLDGTCAYWGIGGKLDEVKKYWDMGYQTTDIPWEILKPYADQDVEATYQCYLKQLEYLKNKPTLFRLIRLGCYDIHTLADMEWNGLKLNESECKERAHEIRKQIQAKEAEIIDKYGLSSIPFNFGSGDHLSAFLYGGTITEIVKVPDGFFKTGKRKGEVKYKNHEKLHVLIGLYTPLKGSELKKDGYFSTDEETLKQLKGDKELIHKLMELSKLEKVVSTYYEGIPRVALKLNWEEGWLHGNLNQCVARTGRLSSTSPNLQNLDKKAQSFIISRWD